MKIHILGASCAGTTTLGKALALCKGMPYFDTDDYFWEKSTIPYTVKRDANERNGMLLADLGQHESWVLGGSVIKWDDKFCNLFDLLIFLYLPADIRMQRLHNREIERYGEGILTDPIRKQLYEEFKAWAANYDNPNFTGRSVKAHREWLQNLNLPTLELTGDLSVEERLQQVLTFIDDNVT